MSKYIQISNQGSKGFAIMTYYVVWQSLILKKKKKSGLYLYGQNQNSLCSTASFLAILTFLILDSIYSFPLTFPYTHLILHLCFCSVFMLSYPSLK